MGPMGKEFGELFGLAGVGAAVGSLMFGPMGCIAYCCGMAASESIFVATTGALGGAVVGSTVAGLKIEVEHDKQSKHPI